jgi:hypothetical protein
MTTFRRERGEQLSLTVVAEDSAGNVIDLRGTEPIEGVPEGAPHLVRVSGFLSDGTDAVEFPPLIPAGGAVEAFGQIFQIYTPTGDPSTGVGEEYAFGITRVISTGAVTATLVKLSDGVVAAEWNTSLAPNSWSLQGANWDLSAVDSATGVPVVVGIYPSLAYTVDAWIKSATTGRVRESMSPAIDDQGRAVITYDTVNLKPGTYYFDIRFTAEGADQITPEITLIVNGTVTPPSPRP